MDALENVVLYWLLPSEENRENIPVPIESLQTLFTDIRIFEDADRCIDDLTSISDINIFLVLGVRRPNLVDILVDGADLRFIYLLAPWTDRYSPKIRGVFPTHEELLKQLASDVKLMENSDTHLRVTNVGDCKGHQASAQHIRPEDLDSVWSKVLIELLLQMPRPSETIYEEVLSECRRIYHNNPVQLRVIDEFEKNYCPSKAIWWYTRNSFVYRLVNMALRTENISIILKFRFIIQDIYQQLFHMSTEQRNNSDGACDDHLEVMFFHLSYVGEEFPDELILYRGQLVNPNELESFRKSIGKMVSMTSFTSTTKDLGVAYQFSGAGGHRPHLESVIFEIIFRGSDFVDQLPPSLADISRVSSTRDEKEVLLCIGTVMRLESIRTDSRVTYIRLHICPYDELLANKMTEIFSSNGSMGKLDTETSILFQLAFALAAKGEFEKGVKVYSIMKSKGNPFANALLSIISPMYRLLPNLTIDSIFDSNMIVESKEIFKSAGHFINQVPISSSCVNVLKSIVPIFSKMTHSVDFRAGNTIYDWDELLSVVLNAMEAVPNEMPEIEGLAEFKFVSTQLRAIFGSRQPTANSWDELEMTVKEQFRSDGRNQSNFFMYMGSRAFREGDLGRALKYFNKAVSLPGLPNTNISCHGMLGLIHRSQNNFPKAIESYQAIIEAPNLPANSYLRYRTHLDRGDAFLALGEVSEAYLSYTNALSTLHQHYPQDHLLTSEYHLRMIHLFRAVQNKEAALDNLEAILTFQVEAPQTVKLAYQSIGCMHVEMDDYSNARASFLQAFQYEKNTPTFNCETRVICLWNLAFVEHKVGDHHQRDIYIAEAMEVARDKAKLRHTIMKDCKEKFDLTVVDPFAAPQLELD